MKFKVTVDVDPDSGEFLDSPLDAEVIELGMNDLVFVTGEIVISPVGRKPFRLRMVSRDTDILSDDNNSFCIEGYQVIERGDDLHSDKFIEQTITLTLLEL